MPLMRRILLLAVIALITSFGSSLNGNLPETQRNLVTTAEAADGSPDWPVQIAVFQDPKIDRWVIAYHYQVRPECHDGRCFFVTENAGGMGPPTEVRRFIGREHRNWIVSWWDWKGYHERYELGAITRRESVGTIPFTWGEFGYGKHVRLNDGREAHDCEFQPSSMDGTVTWGAVGHHASEAVNKQQCVFALPPRPTVPTPTTAQQPISIPTSQPCSYDSDGNAICPPTTSQPSHGLWTYNGDGYNAGGGWITFTAHANQLVAITTGKAMYRNQWYSDDSDPTRGTIFVFAGGMTESVYLPYGGWIGTYTSGNVLNAWDSVRNQKIWDMHHYGNCGNYTHGCRWLDQIVVGPGGGTNYLFGPVKKTGPSY